MKAILIYQKFWAKLEIPDGPQLNEWEFDHGIRYIITDMRIHYPLERLEGNINSIEDLNRLKFQYWTLRMVE